MTAMRSTRPSTVTTRLVLVIQHEHAYWFKVIKDRVVDEFVEPVISVGDAQAVLCPWISTVSDGEPQLVELVLDTSLDEVDRVGVSQSHNLLLNAYRRQMTLLRLRRDYPQASVYALPTVYQGQVATIMHPVIPERWNAWLSVLQENRVVFHRMCTGSELAADWAGRNLNGCALLVMPAGKARRHMLVDCGVMVFLRAVSGLPDTTDAGLGVVVDERDAIEQSIEHLRSCVVAPDKGIRVISAFEPARENAVSKGPVRCLVSMLLELPIQFESAYWQSDNTLSVSEKLVASVSGRDAKKPVSFIHSISLDRLIARIMPPGNRPRRWTLMCSATRWICVLAPSVKYSQARERLARMSRLSLLLAVIAGISATAAISNGFINDRYLHRRDVQRLSIERSISLVITAAGKLAERPVVTADSLILADLLTDQKNMSPDYLLDTIATALVKSPDVSVEHLVWTYVESDEEFESLNGTLGAVPHRQSVTSQPDDNVLQLEISGQVWGRTLHDQQSHIDAFVGELLRSSKVVDVRISESPVDTALSSEHGSEEKNVFRLSLVLSDT